MIMTMTVRHTDKSVHGDIDQQLRHILMPDARGGTAVLFLQATAIGTGDKNNRWTW
jgi:hypothetical protein